MQNLFFIFRKKIQNSNLYEDITICSLKFGVNYTCVPLEPYMISELSAPFSYTSPPHPQYTKPLKIELEA